ncbi:hypothetical protein AB0M39_25785 [Streptomyces sp. NPDC051907]|uniref:hypothetical protein n=1 Tax=Streptomyces sp. NPDC051907 TaxID=3155284 RepID=UPI00343F061A
MARKLNDHDRYRIGQAREALAAAAVVDLSDDRALCRMLGRLEVALSQLLDVIDEEGQE